MSSRPTLTTTSYAVLGLLAVRPWSSYELTRQMDRGLARFWPRAASKLYEEPKKLASHGLARASRRTAGRRSRTVYTITAAGRRRLAAWMAEPASGPALEAEQLLKVFFAENGSKQDLLNVLAGARRWAQQQTTANAEIARSYVAGEAAFPGRLAHTLLVGRFLADFEDMVARWAHWATGIAEGWPDDISSAVADQPTLHYLAARDRESPERTIVQADTAPAGLSGSPTGQT
ncbi:MAG TPA: helix-turn-helix transcriptional regulator [Streptosporangiaceae bacterium]|jgi:DNA-binding PadR family transcriptional regulator